MKCEDIARNKNVRYKLYRVSLIKNSPRFSRKWLKIGEYICYQRLVGQDL